MKKFIGIAVIIVVIAGIYMMVNQSKTELTDALGKQRDAQRTNDIKSIQTRLEIYYADSNNSYPPGSEIVLGESSARALTLDGFGDSVSGADKVYIEAIPANPKPNGVDYVYNAYTQEGGQVCLTAPCGYYTIDFEIEDDTPNTGIEVGPHQATPSGIR